MKTLTAPNAATDWTGPVLEFAQAHPVASMFAAALICMAIAKPLASALLPR